MRSVLIVGAGQSGLLLGLLLRARGYDVTVMTDRSADEVRAGSIMSTQVMFGPALGLERSADLAFWQATAPRITTLEFSMVGPDGQPLAAWAGRLPEPAQSVDQRDKFARWMRLFTDGGGRLAVGPITVESVDRCRASNDHDLVVVAAAGSAMATLFPPDELRASAVPGPRRRLSALYLHGVESSGGRGQFVAVPGCGEIVAVPALSAGEVCHTLLLEALPGGPWDRFGAVADDPGAHLAAMLSVLSCAAPALHDRYRHGVLTDAGARLVGAVTPVVRHPVGALPSGWPVVGMGDTVCRMDPLGAQGANTATRCSARFGMAVLAHGERPFDREWMLGTAGGCWDSFVRPALAWTDLLLDAPPPVRELMVAAAGDQDLADAVAAAFADPSNSPVPAAHGPLA
jgi:hypothetical protein